MSHMYELSKLKKVCDTTGQCREYELRLQQEQQKVDYSSANANQTAVVWGIAFGLIGLFVLLTPLSRFIKRLHKIVLPGLVAAMPIIAGLVIGLVIGFSISFGACFKQQCSSAESSAIYTVPLLSLVLTIPLVVIIYKKRSSIVKSIDRIKDSTWTVVGVLIVLFAVVGVYSVINNNIRNSEVQKTNLTS